MVERTMTQQRGMVLTFRNRPAGNDNDGQHVKEVDPSHDGPVLGLSETLRRSNRRGPVPSAQKGVKKSPPEEGPAVKQTQVFPPLSLRICILPPNSAIPRHDSRRQSLLDLVCRCCCHQMPRAAIKSRRIAHTHPLFFSSPFSPSSLPAGPFQLQATNA